HLILISIITVREQVINAVTPYSVIIIIALPDAAKRVEAEFIIISEVPTNNFKFLCINIATQRHTVLKGGQSLSDFPAMNIFQRGSMRICQASTVVAKIEIELTVRAKDHCVYSVITL